MADNDNHKQDFGMDPVMSLAQRAIEHAKSTDSDVLIMGLGKPTFPIDLTLAEQMNKYWHRIFKKSKNTAIELVQSKKTFDSAINDVVKRNAAISYGHPQGDAKARKIMAAALSQWYGPKDPPESKIAERTGQALCSLGAEGAPDYESPEDLITADDVLFTVGGAGALYIIFQAINKETPNGLIVTPFPHYSLYVGPDHSNNLFPIHLMDKKAYKLTAEILKESLDAADKKAQQQGTKVSAFLLCDPDNPRGQVLGEDELRKIADVLKDYLKIYPNMKIILDEAYAEMQLNGEKHVSLLQVAPDLKNNMIVLRSATKGFSAAGERFALIIERNKNMMKRLVNEAVNIWGHPSISAQIAYAKAMEHFVKDRYLQKLLASYYSKQIGLACQELKKIGAQMPDPDYKVDGTFYVLADLSDLFGTELHPDAQEILNKVKISTDEDICHHLLYQENVFISPLSYFGVPAKKGFVRITCSGGSDEINKLIEILGIRLLNARLRKRGELKQAFTRMFNQIKEKDPVKLDDLRQKYDDTIDGKDDQARILLLKTQNLKLKEILSEAKVFLGKMGDNTIRDEMAIRIQRAYRRYKFLQNMEQSKPIRMAFKEAETAFLAEAKKYFRSRRSEDFFGSNNGDSPMKKTKSVQSFSIFNNCIKGEAGIRMLTTSALSLNSPVFKSFTKNEGHFRKIAKVETPRNGEGDEVEADNRSFFSKIFPSCF